jgi:hypothetical protein
MSLEPYADEIANLVASGSSYEDISSHLRRQGLRQGYSVANIRHFCRERNLNIRQAGPVVIAQGDLEEVVGAAVGQVGAMYGRRRMRGYLASRGILAPEKRIGNALRTIQPRHNQQRRQVSFNHQLLLVLF